MSDSTIPASFAEWQECITMRCGIPLTRAFVEARLAALDDPHRGEAQRFAAHYGELHLQQVREWFDTARCALSDEGSHV